MPSSLVHTFTDPDELSMVMDREGDHKFTVTQRGVYRSKFFRVTFDRLSMARHSSDLSQTTRVDYWSHRVSIAFRTQPGPGLIPNGQEMAPTALLRRRPGEIYTHLTLGPSSNSGMSLPLEDMASLSTAMIGRDLSLLNDNLRAIASPIAIARLRRLHDAAGNLAEDAPAVLAQPEAARGLEQALIGAMMDCLGGGDIAEDRSADRQHTAIMRRFHRAIEQPLDQPLYISELCKEVGASARTLGTCCQEHLGMGPKHYLLLRRMHMARRALRRTAPTDVTVTDVATRYGFWQLGRFAVEYKALFGESPSATLAGDRGADAE